MWIFFVARGHYPDTLPISPRTSECRSNGRPNPRVILPNPEGEPWGFVQTGNLFLMSLLIPSPASDVACPRLMVVYIFGNNVPWKTPGLIRVNLSITPRRCSPRPSSQECHSRDRRIQESRRSASPHLLDRKRRRCFSAPTSFGDIVRIIRDFRKIWKTCGKRNYIYFSPR